MVSLEALLTVCKENNRGNDLPEIVIVGGLALSAALLAFRSHDVLLVVLDYESVRQLKMRSEAMGRRAAASE